MTPGKSRLESRCTKRASWCTLLFAMLFSSAVSAELGTGHLDA